MFHCLYSPDPIPARGERLDNSQKKSKIPLMRQTYLKEIETRNSVVEFIKAKGTPQRSVQYYSPSELQKLLRDDDIDVSIEFIRRRYAELGVKLVRGLWQKDL